MMEAEVEVMHFKDRQDCEPRDVGLLWKLEKTREQIVP